jgi:glutaredoxin/glutathione-dependent peroxiredoxin
MTISKGAKLPEANLLRMGAAGPEAVPLAPKLKGRKVVLFGVPGAYTGTCTTAHVPSFIRTAGKLKAKGVDEIICVAVNDPFVMQAWGESTGATAAGITMLGDSDGSFTKSIGLDFSAAPAGLFGRAQRFSLYAVDGVVQVLNVEKDSGVCVTSGGETILDQI